MLRHVQLALFLLGLAVAVGCDSSSQPEANVINGTPKSPAPDGVAALPPAIDIPADSTPVFKGSATALRSAFLGDQEDATKRFAGKWVQISGKFLQRGSNYIELEREDGVVGPSAHCQFQPNQGYDAMNSLRGRPITLKGVVDDFNFGATFLIHCEVIELGQDPQKLLTATVDEISEAFQTDEAAAAKQYGDRTLRVDGVVAEVKESELLLRGEDEKSTHFVACTLPISDPDLKDLKPGMPVKVIGSSATFGESADFQTHGKIVMLSYGRMWKEAAESAQ
ncbi:OB-fold protein [Blastopirellula marina]|uniref:DUF5666 domain-containing protein n=1 Tax=Blastopirellula marina TaxID=124 RepID=A0A2S8GS64_9BACT|nr:hypothetical protein [Blastopirellula marina]PQO47252.1 hypothetical protein C5Y93_04215 [Blastopirellula marina]